MSNLPAWLSAARPRTLPLSLSGILVGAATAYDVLNNCETVACKVHVNHDGSSWYWWVLALALLTTVSFQVLSNFANDYGDGVKGTDNEDRIGPMRALQSGAITAAQMKKAIIITSAISVLFTLALIRVSFGTDAWLEALFFLVLGIVAIGSAIKYTVGGSAYGYRGLGDVFVFLFFGLVAVVGTHYLLTRQIPAGDVWFMATAVGLLSTAVLHLNNMRDIVSDRKVGKMTLAVKMGGDRSKRYHSLLILGAFSCALVAEFWQDSWVHMLYLIPFSYLLVHLYRVWNQTEPQLLDPELKRVALSTFAMALLFFAAHVIF